MMLVVAHPKSLPKLQENMFWLYADDDLSGYNYVEKMLGSQYRYISPSDYQMEIDGKKKEYLNWVDQQLEISNIEDWIVASYFKDIFCTPTFVHYVCIRLLEKAITDKKNILVVSRHYALAKQLAQLTDKHHAKYILYGLIYFYIKSIRWYLSSLLHFTYRPFWIIMRMYMARLYLGSKYQSEISKRKYAVETFLFNDDLKLNGEFNDRFMPGLLEWLNSKEVSAVSLAYTGNIPTRKLPSLYQRIMKSKIIFAPGELYLRVYDIFRGVGLALKSVLSYPGHNNTESNKTDLSIFASFWWRQSALRTVIYQIWRFIPYNMIKKGFLPDVVLDWYENQPLDKALSIGFLNDVRHCCYIASRQYFPTSGVVNFYTTNGEIKAKASPILNGVCGERTAQLFSKYNSIGKYSILPALRYSGIFSESIQKNNSKLAIFLTSSFEESMGIIQCVLDDTQHVFEKFESVVIKIHQSLNSKIKEIINRKYVIPNKHKILWTDVSSRELLQETSMVVTGGSSVALEAVCLGIPVIIIGRKAGINLNPLEDVNFNIWKVVYDNKEFAYIIKNWFPLIPDFEERKKIGIEIRNYYFEEVTSESMQKFLGVTGNSPSIKNMKSI